MFNENNITKRSNLLENDSISCYLNYGAQQNSNAYKAFYNFIDNVKPVRILEIGTGQGGFTMFLKICCNDLELNTDIRSYEVNQNPSYEVLRKENINVIVENIFSDNYSSVKQEVIEYIQSPGKTIVLCDGGSKISEFNILSNYLKLDDFILAHDYASTTEYFNEHVNQKLWNWHEIQDSDISEAVERNNLQPFMQDEFNQAVWVCKVKK